MTQDTAGTPGQRPPAAELSAGAFNDLLKAFERLDIPLEPNDSRAAAERQREAVRTLIEGNVTDAKWRALLREARAAAAHGAREYLLLQFPSATCADQGRAIAAHDPRWAETLTSDAASIYQRWKADLAPHGFALAARILEFPDGVPGDAGLFLQGNKGARPT